MSDDRCPADQPHTSMDVDGIHVEGHWKRSPENDAAIAEVVKAAANKVNPPAPSDEVEEARNALGLLLTYARCSHIDAANGKNTCDDLYEKVDAVLTTLRKQAERDAAVVEAAKTEADSSLGYNCPHCDNWTYLLPMFIAEDDFIVQCGNEDCAEDVRILVDFAALSTREGVE